MALKGFSYGLDYEKLQEISESLDHCLKNRDSLLEELLSVSNREAAFKDQYKKVKTEIEWVHKAADILKPVEGYGSAEGVDPPELYGEAIRREKEEKMQALMQQSLIMYGFCRQLSGCL